MMCGLLVPTSGNALVLNMDLKTGSGKARQHLGYMAQKFSLYGNLTVEQNLRFFFRRVWPARKSAKRQNPQHERSLWPR
ncbi:Uncharacterized ABC transporter ATP-binding protein YbhF [Kluyvera cryocrescens]|uniref:Uncharacterized ABC transporter ATP-binding protein YbhF n=1 Tax=Kluyvera cryocrescens TaxID=580 RepID=A0A485ANY7_KLUCR|nr:Uncharacterized ABC transporter ATP-binding protein YbhF [Kluyvera cryocrescens]